MDRYSGKRLDARYEIQELIGVGGMAYVYKAYDIIDDRTVAIKILKEEFLGNQDFMRRFKNESKAIAMLDHPNIVKVFSVSFGDRMQYIVMEYIDGIPLKEYFNRQKADVSWKEALHFTAQILKALHHAHENGIIHRDIKPQNIMLLQDGTIKVTDFGIARFSHSETRTMTDQAIGSVHYIAPEQARGELTDGKTDIYSVGVMLYEMITGQLPFEADNAVSVAIMQLQTDPKPPREINPAIPVGLEEITLRAMQKNPQQRYQSAREMLIDLDTFRRDPGIRFNYFFKSVNPDATRVVNNLGGVTSGYETAARTSAPRSSVPQTPSRPPVQETPRYNDNYAYEHEEYNRKEPGKKKTGLIIGLCAGGAAVAAGIIIGLLAAFGAFSGGGGGDTTSSMAEVVDVDLPQLAGQKWEDVQKNPQYSTFNFKVTYEESEEHEEGVIISQNPHGVKKVKSNTVIELIVSSGVSAVEVPDVTDEWETDAKRMLKEAGFKVKVEEIASDEIEAGKVVKTNPEIGNKVPKGEEITIYVSTGVETVKVPPITGSTIADAKNQLSSAGLTVNNITYTNSDDVAKGYIVSVTPGVGTEVEKNSTVDIVVSEGPKKEEVKEKELNVQVNLPSGVEGQMTLDSYVNGSLYYSTQVTSSQRTFSLGVKGKTGTQSVQIYLDDQIFAEYTVDYGTGTVRQTGSYQYTPSTNSGDDSGDYTEPDIGDENTNEITD